MASASIGDPQSLNLFAYVGNNPIDFVDPSGLDDCGGPGQEPCDETGDPPIIIDAIPAYNSFWQFLLHSMENRRRVEPEQPIDDGARELPGGGIIDEESSNRSNASSNPCAGKTLNYNAPGDNGWSHMVDRHINQTAYWRRRHKSLYGSGASTPNLSARKSRVRAINNLTFNYGGVTTQKDPVTGDTTHVYVLAISASFFNLIQVFAVGKDGTKAHRGEYTNVNTLVVLGDCETVKTSHPGLPSRRLTPNPTFVGTPQWWKPSLVLPL